MKESSHSGFYALRSELKKAKRKAKSLESDYTSARSELETANTELERLKAENAHLYAKNDNLQQENEQLKGEFERLKSEIESDEGLYGAAKRSDTVRDRIITDYLSSLEKRRGVTLVSGGVMALTPVMRPKNLADAKRLADKIIRQ